jgi:hypothetical protein
VAVCPPAGGCVVVSEQQYVGPVGIVLSVISPSTRTTFSHRCSWRPVVARNAHGVSNRTVTVI